MIQKYFFYTYVFWILGMISLLANERPDKAEKPREIHFMEELRIGPRDLLDHHLWPDPSVSAAIDSKGGLYVCDTRESRVLHFSKDGTFLGVVLKKGEGPGELANLANFQILEGDRAVAFELQGGQQTFNFYDEEMRYEKSVPARNQGFSPIFALVAPDASKFAATFNVREVTSPELTDEVGVADFELKLLKELSANRIRIPNRREIQTPGFWVKFFENILTLSLSNQGLCTFGKAGAYTKPVLLGLIPMEDGHLLAVTEENREKDVQNADDYDARGHLVGRAKAYQRGFVGEDGRVKMIFKNGKAYTMETDLSGDRHLVRYAFQWQ